MHNLKQFLQLTAGKPFVYGIDDCCLFLADWWRLNHGSDPAGHLRGTYRTKEECEAVIAAHGGVVGLVSDLARRAGAISAIHPQPGDFGLVRANGTHLGVVVTDDGWLAGKSISGLCVFRNVKPELAWKI